MVEVEAMTIMVAVISWLWWCWQRQNIRSGDGVAVMEEMVELVEVRCQLERRY